VAGVNHKTGASPGLFGRQKGFDVRETLQAGDSSPRFWAGMMGAQPLSQFAFHAF
jgi:hypothetical protein